MVLEDERCHGAQREAICSVADEQALTTETVRLCQAEVNGGIRAGMASAERVRRRRVQIVGPFRL